MDEGIPVSDHEALVADGDEDAAVAEAVAAGAEFFELPQVTLAVHETVDLFGLVARLSYDRWVWRPGGVGGVRARGPERRPRGEGVLLGGQVEAKAGAEA